MSSEPLPPDVAAAIHAGVQHGPRFGGLVAALVEPDAHPFRWMPDRTPCWCFSADEPHEGWVHAPACQSLLRERLAAVLRLLTDGAEPPEIES